MATTSELLVQGYRNHIAGNYYLAEVFYKQILAQDPIHTEVLQLMSILAKQTGRMPESQQYQANVAQLNLNKAIFYNDLGVKLNTEGHPQEAFQCYQHAISLNPSMAEAYSNLAGMLQQQGRYEEAVFYYKQALSHKPDMAAIYLNTGFVLEKMRRYEEAKAFYIEALNRQPSMVEGYNNLGNVMQALGQFNDAIVQYDKALAINPQYPEPYSNKGFAYQNMGQVEKAIHFFNEALKLKPDYEDAFFNRTLAYLLNGDYAEGWAGYETRYTREEFAPKRIPIKPYWDGSELKGQKLLIITEQGFGDTFQFLRFLPWVKEKGGHIVLGAPPELADLLQHASDVDEIVVLPPEGMPECDYDTNLFMMSLPHVFKNDLNSLPPTPENALVLPQEWISDWREKLGHPDTFKIGMVWSGNVKNPRNIRRSCLPENFATLFDIPNTVFYSLQKGIKVEEGKVLHPYANFVDLDSQIQNFTDTAAIIANMDLIVTVDTAVAHLAAILGKPVWLLLSAVPDWRWMLNRTDTPWYPNMKLYRQTTLNDWPELFSRVKPELKAHVAQSQAAKAAYV